MDAEQSNPISRAALLQWNAFGMLYPLSIDTIAGQSFSVVRVTRCCDAHGVVISVGTASRFDLYGGADGNQRPDLVDLLVGNRDAAVGPVHLPVCRANPGILGAEPVDFDVTSGTHAELAGVFLVARGPRNDINAWNNGQLIPTHETRNSQSASRRETPTLRRQSPERRHAKTACPCSGAGCN